MLPKKVKDINYEIIWIFYLCRSKYLNILPLNGKIEHKVTPEMNVSILNGFGLKAH